MSSQERPTPYRELAEVIASLPLLCRERRRQCGLSVRAAGRQIGVSAATVSRLENGEDLNGANLAAVLQWLDTSPRGEA